jgi:predicted exporter
VAARRARDRARALARVARPITVGALTTLSVFVALFLSRIPAYRQFAWVAVLSILLSLAASLFLLPQFITPAAPSPTPTGPAPALRRSRRAHAARLLLFAAALAAGIAFAWRAPFDTSITRLDATTPDILAAEERFQRVWGGGEKNQALCVVTAPDYEQALAAAETVQRRATERLGPDALLGLTSLWPSRATRERNAAAWAQFWNADRTARCRSLLAAAGAEFKFTATAFDPFFEGLGQGPPVGPEPDDNRVFARLKERFVQRQRDGYAVMAFFPDRPETVAALRELCRDVPGAQVVSRQAFSDELAGTVTREVAGIALLAAALIVAVNLLLTRSLAMAATSLLPAALGTAWGFGIVGLLGLSINVTNLVASLVVFGLSVDYGAYFAYMYRDRTAPDETHRAVTLCVTTTVLGAAILLFARHPTLFSIGLTLTAGITAGYIAAVAFTPAVYALLSRDEP